MSAHTLMTVLGRPQRDHDSKEILWFSYQLDSRCYKAQLAPIALFHLLRHSDRSPTRILALCTKEAKSETYPILNKALLNECEIEPVLLPPGDQPQDMYTFLDKFADAVPTEGTLTIEFTHGFRHYALLMLLGAFYVDALRHNLELQNIYYALQKFDGPPSPYIDLRQLLDFFKWISAADTFRNTGSALPMADLIKRAGGPDHTKDMVRNLENLSRALADALPLELGVEARNFLDRYPRHLYKLTRKTLPSSALSEELRDTVKQAMACYAIPNSGCTEKSQITLDASELQRQANIIDNLYYDYGNFAASFGLMREWVVSWAILRLGADGDKWLDWKKMRRKAERALGLLGNLAQLKDEGKIQLMPDDQYRLALFWRYHLGPTRNAAHHHGMRPASVFGPEYVSNANEAWQFWSQVMKHMPEISLSAPLGVYRNLIVSPLGNTPGVLFSAIKSLAEATSERDVCLVISSQQAQRNMDEALDRAGFAGKRELLLFQNPYSGLQERGKLLEKATEYVLKAEETHVNLTGGTSLMGLLSEEIAAKAKKFQRVGSRFMLIDERPYNEQLENPYVEGQKIVVESFMEEPGVH